MYFTVQGNAKRIKIEEIPLNNRGGKGVMICKIVKSHPSVLADVVAFTNDPLTFDDEAIHTISAYDVPLKGRETGFTAIMPIKTYYRIEGIEVCEVIPFGDSVEEVHEDVEKISLF